MRISEFDEGLQQWAHSRETDIEVAKAIFEIASGEDEADAIWEDPTEEQWIAIWEIVTKNGLLDGNDFPWGNQKPLGNSHIG